MNVLREASPSSGVLRVRIDRGRCQGHARCVALAPELFEVDAFGDTRELGGGVVAGHLLEKVELAVANCPELALAIVRERA
ncbi:ferredoxin [Bradyrhizobium sp.]|uniref:ferredoxin n=1 Tax=Bradyrhizobium sp. TaxID=376 RepID=UPI002BA8630E|nr:ferredoxin [Bradyrhizobium sp.]HWX57863.1 ferredoxin [Bradyrhizobium sp.]